MEEVEISSLQIWFFWYNKSVANHLDSQLSWECKRVSYMPHVSGA